MRVYLWRRTAGGVPLPSGRATRPLGFALRDAPLAACRGYFSPTLPVPISALRLSLSLRQLPTNSDLSRVSGPSRPFTFQTVTRVLSDFHTLMLLSAHSD